MLGRRVSLFLLLASSLAAHPMGNFSVSHYARLNPEAGRLSVLYSLDLAEIPTFELTRGATLDAGHAEIERAARQQVPAWVRGLKVTANGQPLRFAVARTQVWVTDGAGGMPVVRIAMHLSAPVAHHAVRLEYEDTNFEGRTGWKEVVIAGGAEVSIVKSSSTHDDRSKALSEYPADPMTAPPQELNASLEWKWFGAPPKMAPPAAPVPPVTAPSSAVPPTAGGPQQQAPGALQRGDFLSTLLGKKEIPLSLALAGLAAALTLGAMHAMSPGHGKTIVAAYLVGSRGTARHAAVLGGMVTFTHTVSVFLLGLATLFLSKYFLPEKILPWLGAISGFSIVLIGLSLFRRRLATLLGREVEGHHHHHLGHSHDHEHHHGDGNLHHHHHMPEGEVTLANLVALGVSGGLVPCPSALVLLLSAIALGRTGYGLLLLVAFSAGLAAVLMGIGMLVLYAKNLIPSSRRTTESPAFRLIPVLSAAVIVGIGIVMTVASTGIVKPPGI